MKKCFISQSSAHWNSCCSFLLFIRSSPYNQACNNVHKNMILCLGAITQASFHCLLVCFSSSSSFCDEFRSALVEINVSVPLRTFHVMTQNTRRLILMVSVWAALTKQVEANRRSLQSVTQAAFKSATQALRQGNKFFAGQECDEESG